MHEIVLYTFLDVCEKITYFCQVLKRCTQKKIRSIFLPHGVVAAFRQWCLLWSIELNVVVYIGVRSVSYAVAAVC